MALLRRIAVLAAVLVAAAVWSGAALADAPGNTRAPVLEGRPQVGATLFQSDPGDWTNAGDAYTATTYAWLRCDAAGGACVDTGFPGWTTYTVQPGDAGHTIVLKVTKTNADGSATAQTNPSYPISTVSVSTPHFVVHYQTDPKSDAAITQTQAGDIAAAAERAYAVDVANGYPLPVSDAAIDPAGDARTDIYVGKIEGAAGLTFPEGRSAYIVLDGSTPYVTTPGLVAHEFFHVLQFGMWPTPQLTDYWLLESSAEWAAYQADPDYTLATGNWDISLDCRDPVNGNVMCDTNGPYENNGYARWPFWEYTTEQYGSGFLTGVFGNAWGAASALVGLEDALVAKGTTLSDVFNAWTVANLTGGYSLTKLQNVLPPPYGSPIVTGSLASLNASAPAGTANVKTKTLASVTVPVNHLSARYLALERGDPTHKDAICYSATLDLQLALPAAGIGGTPYYWWSGRNADGSKQAAIPFSISGTTATLSVPWDTCDWGATYGYVSLPNPTDNLDGQDYTLTGTMTVDPSKPVNPPTSTTTTTTTTTPAPTGPTPVKVHGQVIDAGSFGDTPSIDLFGPQLITIAAGAKALRLIVESDASGKVRASLGSTSLGTLPIRAGGNDLRFALPTKVVAALKGTKTVKAATKKTKAAKQAAAALTLTLTPVSAGGSGGTPVTRRVVMRPAVAKTVSVRR